jgi:hypothetical protein
MVAAPCYLVMFEEEVDAAMNASVEWPVPHALVSESIQSRER